MHFPTPGATELAGITTCLFSVLLLLHRGLFVFMSLFYFVVTVSFGLLAATASHAPLIAAISPAPPFLGAAPLFTNGTNRSTHSERRLTRSVWFCISKAPPSLHVTRSARFCCSLTSFNSDACRSDLDSFTTAVNLHRNGQGGLSLSCKVEYSSGRNPDSPTTSINNRLPSPILVSPPFASTPRHAASTNRPVSLTESPSICPVGRPDSRVYIYRRLLRKLLGLLMGLVGEKPSMCTW